MYAPRHAPLADKAQSDLVSWLNEELQAVSRSFREFDIIQHRVLSNEPRRPREGMIVYSDGVNWNPGGPGAYVYSGGSWIRLGVRTPLTTKSVNYTLGPEDAESQILHPSADVSARTWTIPADATTAFAVGTKITFINQNGAGVLTIAINLDTMRLEGPGTTGARTLAANGIAHARKITTTEWIIEGVGLT